MHNINTTPSVVIIFTPSDGEESQPFTKPTLAAAYENFFTLAEENGLLLYRASTRWYDQGQKKFRIAWCWVDGRWQLQRDIKPRAIYDKAAVSPETQPVKQLLEENFPFINALAFSDHAGSKFLVNQTFSQFSKPYYRVESSDELASVLDQLPGSIVVVKPEQGNSGNGILILSRERLSSFQFSFPLLIQEFIDSSAGIPGIMKGLHDLRLIYSGEELVYAYYRTPKSGSYLANVAQGGTQTMINPDDLPASIHPIVEAIQKHYSEFHHKIYTIDLIFDQAGIPWIVELNTMPGLYPDESERPHIHHLYLAIITTLQKALAETK